MQYHWRNAGYGAFDDFLGRFSSKRRNQIKREARGPDEQGLVLETFDGSELATDRISSAPVYLVLLYLFSLDAKHLDDVKFLERVVRVRERRRRIDRVGSVRRFTFWSRHRFRGVFLNSRRLLGFRLRRLGIRRSGRRALG